jgi:hypothetical protein
MIVPLSLKSQLAAILPKYPNLRVPFKPDCNEIQLKEIAWVVEDFVNQNPQVVEDDDLLKDWLDRYRFQTSRH